MWAQRHGLQQAARADGVFERREVFGLEITARLERVGADFCEGHGTQRGRRLCEVGAGVGWCGRARTCDECFEAASEAAGFVRHCGFRVMWITAACSDDEGSG